MFGIHDLPLFILSGLLLNIMPGPDSLLIISHSARQGWRAGSAAALGIGSGTLVHVCAAAVGLSALLTASATAFTVVKWVGAAYIVYVGLTMLLHQPAAVQTEAGNARAPTSPALPALLALPYRKIYLQGLLTNILNPKVALFFLAFVPQFISADAPGKALAFVILGAIFDFNGMLWCHFLAVCTALASARLKVSPVVARWLNRSAGSLLVGLGLKLALTRQH